MPGTRQQRIRTRRPYAHPEEARRTDAGLQPDEDLQAICGDGEVLDRGDVRGLRESIIDTWRDAIHGPVDPAASPMNPG